MNCLEDCALRTMRNPFRLRRGWDWRCMTEAFWSSHLSRGCFDTLSVNWLYSKSAKPEHMTVQHVQWSRWQYELHCWSCIDGGASNGWLTVSASTPDLSHLTKCTSTIHVHQR